MSLHPLAIIGAGPFGLAAAAMAVNRRLPHVAFGTPMELWRQHMPRGMLLRSASDWHLDPCGRHTFSRFLADTGQLANGAPIRLDQLLDYSRWFIDQAGIEVDTRRVKTVARTGERGFEIELEDGTRVTASNVLCTPGVHYFRNLAPEYVGGLPDHLWCHSTAVRELEPFRNRRCLIVGGRQSAYELATLLDLDAGADVTIVHRHAAPAFTESDWSWVAGELERAENEPGWFAAQTRAEQDAIRARFWSEGRLKLEPWLGERLSRGRVQVFANTSIAHVAADGDRVTVTLSDGRTLSGIEQIVLATGFTVDLARVPYLAPALLEATHLVGGSPALDATLQSISVPGLYFAGLVAARDFGPYMGFLASCPFAARRVVGAVEARPRRDGA